MIYDHKEDGITHINIYTKGLSELGRLLSNMAATPFTHKTMGQFKSVEGLIYYLASNDEHLRTLSGFEAKTYGQKVDKKIRLEPNAFRKVVRQTFRHKLEYNPSLKQLLKDSTLPLTHYYVYGNRVIDLPQWKWMVDEWEQIRKDIKAGIL